MQQPRQDPVSCDNCRKRKLKCSREFTCSNCVARSIPCHYSGRQTIRTATSQAPTRDAVRELQQENAAIKDRLARLESLLVNAESIRDLSVAERPTKVRRLSGPSEGIPSPDATPSTQHGNDLTRTYRNDVEWLGAIGTQENWRLRVSNELEVRIESIKMIAQRASSIQEDIYTTLPPLADARHLFDAYVAETDPMQHIIHVPTALHSIDSIYTRLHNRERVEPNETVLLLSILASMASYWSADVPGPANAIFDSHESSRTVANVWLKQTLDIQEHVRRSALATLETVQSYLMIVFLIYHMEGFSPKVRAIFAAALAAAKDLGLHRTDARDSKAAFQSDEADKEIRRRVWWHLASTDWSFAQAGGPHESTYNVHPSHMRVKRPRNVSDEELESMPIDFEHPLSEPTIMGYYIQRIRLAGISRDITDLLCSIEPDELAPKKVLEIDTKMTTMLAELPAFLRVDQEYDGEFQYLNIPHKAIALQRFMVHFALHARRCKFHLPLLLRKEPRYAFSREACLESARAVMKLKLDLSQKEDGLWISNSKLGGFLHLHFFATVVLLMDFCVNRDIVDEAERKTEIQTALRILELAKQQTLTAGLFLDSLMATLRKHKIRLYAGTSEEDERDDSMTNPLTSGDAANQGNDLGAANFDDFDLDELWNSYINSDMATDWTPLLADLQTCAWDAKE